MTKQKMKTLLLAAGFAVLLCGCTKSNIVHSESEAADPDFNFYNDIELDMEQLHEDVDDIALVQEDYPMGAAVDFDLHLDEEYVDVIAVVKDETTPEDAALFADAAIKILNDQVAVQDFTYGESDEGTFGGLYQDNEIHLKVYEESEYESGKPLYETTIPKDTYVKIEIK
ncbi:MAG: hypothetical protein PHV18_09065 [Lachnospiraceae bacterium]|nr:hypothetical protein [Lachnospiraceae bacterium]